MLMFTFPQCPLDVAYGCSAHTSVQGLTALLSFVLPFRLLIPIGVSPSGELRDTVSSLRKDLGEAQSQLAAANASLEVSLGSDFLQLGGPTNAHPHPPGTM
jgi:hypothetical protein